MGRVAVRAQLCLCSQSVEMSYCQIFCGESTNFYTGTNTFYDGFQKWAPAKVLDPVVLMFKSMCEPPGYNFQVYLWGKVKFVDWTIDFKVLKDGADSACSVYGLFIRYEKAASAPDSLQDFYQLGHYIMAKGSEFFHGHALLLSVEPATGFAKADMKGITFHPFSAGNIHMHCYEPDAITACPCGERIHSKFVPHDVPAYPNRATQGEIDDMVELLEEHIELADPTLRTVGVFIPPRFLSWGAYIVESIGDALLHSKAELGIDGDAEQSMPELIARIVKAEEAIQFDHFDNSVSKNLNAICKKYEVERKKVDEELKNLEKKKREREDQHADAPTPKRAKTAAKKSGK